MASASVGVGSPGASWTSRFLTRRPLCLPVVLPVRASSLSGASPRGPDLPEACAEKVPEDGMAAAPHMAPGAGHHHRQGEAFQDVSLPGPRAWRTSPSV